MYEALPLGRSVLPTPFYVAWEAGPHCYAYHQCGKRLERRAIGDGSPSYEDIPLSPTIFRRIRPKLGEGNANQYELLIPAASVHVQLGLLQLASTDQLFTMAAGVFVDGELMVIEAAAEAEAFGCPYLYRLILRGPQNQTL